MRVSVKKIINIQKIYASYKSTPALYLLISIVLFFYLINHSLLNKYNINNLLFNATILFAISGGQTFPILVGGIDLSVGGVVSLLSVIGIVLLPIVGYGTFAIIIMIGACIGLFNGILLTKGKIPSFIATLGVGGICTSIANTITPQPISVSLELEKFTMLFNGKILFFKSIYLWGILLFIFFWLIQTKTILGRQIMFVGSNEKMSFFSGINIVKVKLFAFIFSGIGSAMTSIFLISTLYSGYATLGDVYILNSIASVIVGGTALTGGKGGIVNTLIGVLILGVLTNGMTIIGVNIYIQQVFLGLLVVMAVILSSNKKADNIVK